jgi:AcrR family transcriptional regulator
VSELETTDGRRLKGRRTRSSILDAAANLASVEGLEGLTIGRLAGELDMSKSGLFAHFGSKEELQLATIEAARAVFVERVVEPARQAPAGLPRLEAFMDAWLTYLREKVFEGGCFFDAIRSEFDSRAPGPVRDAIERDFRDWYALVTKLVRTAQKAGHLRADVDVPQLVFELDAIGAAANLRFQLLRDPKIYDRARTAMRARLAAATAA